MKVDAEREDGILIATAVGRVDGANALEFQNALQAAIGNRQSATTMTSSWIWQASRMSAVRACVYFCSLPSK